MKNDLYRILSLIDPLDVSNGQYYRLIDIVRILESISEEEIEIEDTIMTVFYVCDQGVLEIYDYELNIRVVEYPNWERFLLSKTGKESVEAVNSDILSKLQRCYIEVVKPQHLLKKQELQEFLNFVKKSSEIRLRVSEMLQEFDENNICFEVY